MRQFIIFLTSIFLMSCSELARYQYDTGTTDYRYFLDSKNKFETKFFSSSHTNSELLCIKKGRLVDFRLQNSIFVHIFESWFKRKIIGDDKNEFGVFITLSERSLGTTTRTSTTERAETIPLPNRRLVYVSYPRKRYEPLNQINTLIYHGKYNGGDLRLKIEIVEFDRKSKALTAILNSLLNAGKKLYTGKSKNADYTKLLDTIGASIIKNYQRDDLVAVFEMEFLACHSTANDIDQLYLKEGDLVFVRKEHLGRNNGYGGNINWGNYVLNKNKELREIIPKKIGEEKYTTKVPNFAYFVISIIERKTPVTANDKEK